MGMGHNITVHCGGVEGILTSANIICCKVKLTHLVTVETIVVNED